MKESNLENFQQQYDAFRKSGKLKERIKQSRIVPVLREILSATLDNDPLTNEHLTGLIQMTGYGSKINTFKKYLNTNVKDQAKKEKILNQFNEIGETGYTGKGLNAITKPKPEQLQQVKTFLREAFSVKSVDQAVKLVEDFDKLKAPQVTAGVYSPWLHYINPKAFPIINNSILEFRKWLSLPSDYPSFIKAANELKEVVNETDHGRIDWFAHLFKGDSDSPTELIHLNGRKLFKISHGAFVNNSNFKKASILKVLEKNHWISMGNDTGLNQFDIFSEKERMGDYVYVCYGGKNVYAIGQIVSDIKSLNNALKPDFPTDEAWSYREIKILYLAQNGSVTELKNEKKNHMPGGNSTFWEVPTNSINDLNKKIFTPKFKMKFLSDKGPGNMPAPITPSSKNTILYGPPGTGKTYSTIFQSVAIIEKRDIGEIEKSDCSAVKERYDNYLAQGRILFTSFHQSLGYEDFIEGIKPIPPENKGDPINYQVEDGMFKKLCTKAALAIAESPDIKEKEKMKGFSSLYEQLADKLNPKDFKGSDYQPHVMIIDEINRGNIANIFGELITLLEDDKRLGCDTTLTVTLPYSKERFGVPPNLHVIGTMNTADRSAEALDTALRRRFSFVLKEPAPDILPVKVTMDGIDLVALLNALNKRLKVLKDADHTIGHAWLWNVKDTDGLRSVFSNKILPLLKEFFYNDTEKLGLVLGDRFFNEPIPVSEELFASFSGSNNLAGQYQHPIYELKNPEDLTIDDFLSLYQ